MPPTRAGCSEHHPKHLQDASFLQKGLLLYHLRHTGLIRREGRKVEEHRVGMSTRKKAGAILSCIVRPGANVSSTGEEGQLGTGCMN